MSKKSIHYFMDYVENKRIVTTVANKFYEHIRSDRKHKDPPRTPQGLLLKVLEDVKPEHCYSKGLKRMYERGRGDIYHLILDHYEAALSFARYSFKKWNLSYFEDTEKELTKDDIKKIKKELFNKSHPDVIEENCIYESPIEEKLGRILKRETGTYPYDSMDSYGNLIFVNLKCQEEILNGKYRVDFLLTSDKDEKGYPHSTQPPLIVECDGYEFHSTKEQFQRDRKRDRECLLSGYNVMRFTGQEIINQTDLCVEEILKYFERGM